MLDTLIKDLRFAVRSLLKSPGFAVVVVLTLALAIGANTAIFSVVDGILFRPLPFPDADRLVAAWADLSRRDGPVREWMGYDDIRDLRRQTEIFAAVGAYGGVPITLTGHGDLPESLVAARVTREMLEGVLGILPAVGRTFTAEEDAPNAPGAVVLSDALWRRAFAADPDIVGESITLNGNPATVVGVMPGGFRPPFVPNASLWTPIGLETGSDIGDRGNAYLRVIARLQPHVALETARAAMTTLAEARALEMPDYERVGLALFNLHDDVVNSARDGLRVLLGAVAFVLLMACVNIANLLLARGTARGAEIAVRAALGARRFQIVRPLLLETAVLALVGGTLGTGLGWLGTRALVGMAPTGTPRLDEVQVDARILAFTAAATLMVTFMAGLLPAIRTARTNVTEVLKVGGRGADAGAHGKVVRSGLVVVQVALALVLLVGAGLLTRSFLALNQVDAGFDPRGVVAMNLSLPSNTYGTPEHRIAFHERLDERLRALPGVESAALVSNLPLANRDSDSSFHVEGRPLPSPADRSAAWVRRTTPGYFDTMQIRLVAGRDFTVADNRDATLVAIINETTARRYFANENPLGRRITFGDPTAADPVWRQIVGVAHDIKNFGLDADSRLAVYLPYRQVPTGNLYATVRTTGDTASLAAGLRRSVSEIDPAMAVASITTMESMVADSLASERFMATLMSTFALVALTLAVVGLYGVVSYGVGLRLHEMGVRVALGARPLAIRRLIVGSSLALVGGGTVLGLLGAVAASRLIAGLLFGIEATDPMTFVLVSVALLAAGFAASAVPAWRASRVDPVQVLNRE